MLVSVSNYFFLNEKKNVLKKKHSIHLRALMYIFYYKKLKKKNRKSLKIYNQTIIIFIYSLDKQHVGKENKIYSPLLQNKKKSRLLRVPCLHLHGCFKVNKKQIHCAIRLFFVTKSEYDKAKLSSIDNNFKIS